jgi:hypothetical protein
MTELYVEYGPLVLGLILSGISWLYSRFLADKIKSTRVRDMVAAAGQELRAVITEVDNTYVKSLKDAGQDGKWTETEMVEAKRRAVAKFKENWGTTGIKRMTKVLGIGGSVDSWLGTQVEAMVSDKKSALPPKD